jgi:hypothetical protein
VDGRLSRPHTLGLTRLARGPGPTYSFAVSLDVARLDRMDAEQRNLVILHELGHVIDDALVPPALAARLDAAIPATACAPRAERFADTFAEWALPGAEYDHVGYHVPPPASLEAWGAPLGPLAGAAG